MAIKRFASPFTLRYVSCCPANEAPGKSSAVADDRTATNPSLKIPPSLLYAEYTSFASVSFRSESIISF